MLEEIRFGLDCEYDVITLLYYDCRNAVFTLLRNKYNSPFHSIKEHDRISPYNINTVSSRQVMRIKKIN